MLRPTYLYPRARARRKFLVVTFRISGAALSDPTVDRRVGRERGRRGRFGRHRSGALWSDGGLGGLHVAQRVAPMRFSRAPRNFDRYTAVTLAGKGTYLPTRAAWPAAEGRPTYLPLTPEW